MSLLQFFKSNGGKVAFGSIGSVIALIAAMFSLDARYAHAADIERDKIQTQDLIQDTSRTLRRQMLEDKLFELDVKKEQTRDAKLQPIESALRQRYQRSLDELNIAQGRSRDINQTLPRN